MAITLNILGDASKLRKALKKSERGLGRFYKSKVWSRISKRIALTFSVGAAAAGVFGKQIVDLAFSFENAYADIKKATGKTGAEFASVRAEFDRTLGQVPQKMNEVAAVFGQAMTLITDATESQIGKVTKEILDFSRITGAESAAVADSVGKAAASFGLAADEVPGLIDTMTAAAVDFGISGDALAQQLTAFGPSFQAMGFGANETVALFGKLYAAGGEISRLGPGIGAFAQKVAALGYEPRAALEQAIQLIHGTASETEKLAIASDLFGSEAATRMVSAIQSTGGELLNFTSFLEGAKGRTAELGAETLTTGDKWSMTWNRFSTEIAPLVAAAVEFIDRALTWLTQKIDQIRTNWPKWWAQVTKIFHQTMSVISSIIVKTIDIIQGVVEWIVNAGKWIANSTHPAAESIREIWNALLDAWEVVREAITKIFDWAKVILTVLVVVVGGALYGVYLWFKDVWDEILAIVTIVLTTIIDVIANAFKIWGGIADFFHGLFTLNWGKMWDGIKAILSGVIGIITAVVTGAFKWLVVLLKWLWEKAKWIWSKMWDALVFLARSTVNLILGTIESMINGMINLIESAINKLLGLARGAANMVSKIPGFGWAGNLVMDDVDIPDITVPRVKWGKGGGDTVDPGDIPALEKIADTNRASSRQGGLLAELEPESWADQLGKKFKDMGSGLADGLVKGAKKVFNIEEGKDAFAPAAPTAGGTKPMGKTSSAGLIPGLGGAPTAAGLSDIPVLTPLGPASLWTGGGNTPALTNTGVGGGGTPGWLNALRGDDDGSSDLRGGSSGGGTDLSGDVTVVLEIADEDAHIWQLAKEEILDPTRQVRARGGPVAAGHRTLR